MAEFYHERVTGYGHRNPQEVVANDKNWRVHPEAQRLALVGVLGEVGWIDEVTINLRSSNEWGDKQGVETVLDGHLRCDIAVANELNEVPVKFVDLTPVEEAVVLASKDSIAALADTDPEALAALLGEIETLGIESVDLEAFFADLEASLMDFDLDFGKGELDDDEDYKTHVDIVVRVSNFDLSDTVRVTIEDLVAGYPDWKAEVQP